MKKFAAVFTLAAVLGVAHADNVPSRHLRTDAQQYSSPSKNQFWGKSINVPAKMEAAASDRRWTLAKMETHRAALGKMEAAYHNAHNIGPPIRFGRIRPVTPAKMKGQHDV